MRIKSSLILGLVLVCVVLGAAAGGWFLWQQNQALAEDNAQLQSDLAILRNNNRSSGSGDSSGNTLGTSSSAGANDNKDMLVKDFGIKFRVPATLTSLSYAESPPASGMLELTTQTLQSAYPDCAGAGVLGALFRYPKGQPLPASPAAARAQKLAVAGSYQYYYLPVEKNPCTAKAAVDAVTKSASELREALKTLSEQ